MKAKFSRFSMLSFLNEPGNINIMTITCNSTMIIIFTLNSQTHLLSMYQMASRIARIGSHECVWILGETLEPELHLAPDWIGRFMLRV